MLRIATIALLVAVNVSVWLGPAETFVNSGSAILSGSPSLEQAEGYAVQGELDRALAEYQLLVELNPESSACRYEYGIFCYINGYYLQHEAGWSGERLAETVLEQLLRARNLSAGDHELAVKYAYLVLDEDFFGPNIGREQAIEAWKYILASVRQRHANDPAHYITPFDEAHALLQLARIESRFGDEFAAAAYIRNVRAIAPDFRIPMELAERAPRASTDVGK